MDLPDETPLTASVEARALSAILGEVADHLDADDMRSPEAMTAIRAQARRLAQAVRDRGWGDLFWNVDRFHDVHGGELSKEEDEADEDDEPLPEGMRLSYQARIDFVVTDVEALLSTARAKAETDGVVVEGDFADEIDHPVGAVAYLAGRDGFAPKDYPEAGLRLAGAQDSVGEVSASLWEMSDEQGEDSFPFP